MKQKRVFQIILITFALALIILPFVVSLNDLFTRVVENFGWYQWIQQYIVPWEVRIVGVVVGLFGVDFVAYPEGFTANHIYAQLSWNCLGWQSLLLFCITLPIGLSAQSYTLLSKVQASLIGLLGTFLVNILRIVITVILLVISQPLFALVFHDYLAAITTILWLIFFWWFTYRFILEEKALSVSSSSSSSSSSSTLK